MRPLTKAACDGPARDRGHRRRLRCKPPYVKLYCPLCKRAFRPRVWLRLGRGCEADGAKGKQKRARPPCGFKAFGRIVGIGWNGKHEKIDPHAWTSPAGDPICPVRRPFSEGGS